MSCCGGYRGTVVGRGNVVGDIVGRMVGATGKVVGNVDDQAVRDVVGELKVTEVGGADGIAKGAVVGDAETLLSSMSTAQWSAK
jgi:hypothetical protein